MYTACPTGTVMPLSTRQNHTAHRSFLQSKHLPNLNNIFYITSRSERRTYSLTPTPQLLGLLISKPCRGPPQPRVPFKSKLTLVHPCSALRHVKSAETPPSYILLPSATPNPPLLSTPKSSSYHSGPPGPETDSRPAFSSHASGTERSLLRHGFSPSDYVASKRLPAASSGERSQGRVDRFLRQTGEWRSDLDLGLVP